MTWKNLSFQLLKGCDDKVDKVATRANRHLSAGNRKIWARGMGAA